MEIGRRLRRTTKLPFRKLNSISSKQIGERTRTHRLSPSKTLNYVYPIERMQLRWRAAVDGSFDHATWVEVGF
jgi:hypothetical protein